MDGLEAAGDPELRATLLAVRGNPRAVSADEVAAALGVHRNVARFRLERLAEAGLLVTGFERRTGRSGPGAGRPAKTYAAAPELSAIEFPVRRYEQLIGLLVDALPSRGRTASLRAVGAAFADELADASHLRTARSVRRGAEAMCASVRTLGFQASVEEVERDRAVIATPTCPLRPLVREHPDAAEIDRGMWAGLASRALAGVSVGEVRCETRDCLGDHTACRVLIRLRACS